MWLLLAASLLAAASYMPFFERSDDGDFGSGSAHSRGEQAGHAVYLAVMGPSNFAAFSPTSAAGRVASALQAFSLLLIMSAYTANLAAQLTTMDPPVQPIGGVGDFTPALPLCMRSSSTAQALLNNTYPAVAANLLPANVFGVSTYGSRDALDAVLAGQCAGALLPATEAAWLMNVADTAGALCGLIPVGAPQGDEGVPLTFGANALTDAQLEAINLQIAALQRASAWLTGTRAAFFPEPPRAVCGAQDASDAAALASLQPASQLEPIDLAGAFLLQLVGMSLGAVLHVTKRARQRHLPTSRPLAAADDAEPAASGAAPAALRAPPALGPPPPALRAPPAMGAPAQRSNVKLMPPWEGLDGTPVPTRSSQLTRGYVR